MPKPAPRRSTTARTGSLKRLVGKSSCKPSKAICRCCCRLIHEPQPARHYLMEETMNSLKKRIMVIDDEPSLTRLVRLNLEDTGEYEVREENHPDHALAAAREFRPDLI